jgi:hypothetical protein
LGVVLCVTKTDNMRNGIINSNWVIAILTFVNLLIFSYSILRPFDKPRIEADCANELYLDHLWGNVDFFHYFHIRNSGEKQGIITFFKGLVISKDNSSFNKVVKATYYLDKSTNNYYPLVNVTMNSNDIFNSYIQFLKEPSKEQKDSVSYYADLRYNEIEDLMKKGLFYDFRPKEVSKKTFNKIKDFIYRNGLIELKEGSYQYIVSIKTNYQKEPIFTKCFSFVIYPSDLNRIKENLKDYGKGGTNINFSQIREQLRIPLTEIPVNDNLLRQLEQTN